MKHTSRFAQVLALTVLIAGRGSTGRVREPGEAQLVGDTRAGTVTYDQLVTESTNKLVQQCGLQTRAQGPYRVAFVGLDTQGAEELRDQLPAIYEQLEEILVNAGPFVVISRKAVDRARQEAGLRDFDDLYICLLYTSPSPRDS